MQDKMNAGLRINKELWRMVDDRRTQGAEKWDAERIARSPRPNTGPVRASQTMGHVSPRMRVLAAPNPGPKFKPKRPPRTPADVLSRKKQMFTVAAAWSVHV